MAAILADDNLTCIFLNENKGISIRIFTEICSHVSNWQYVNIGSGHGLVPNITWPNVDLVHWHIYGALGGDELIGFCVGNPLVAVGFPAQRDGNANLWWFLYLPEQASNIRRTLVGN